MRRARSRALVRPLLSTLALVLLWLLGTAQASCPSPEFALTSPVAERFRTYLERYFPAAGDRSRSIEDRFILVGYALGRQAPAAGEDPARREAFDCLLVALDQRAYMAHVLRGEFDPIEARRAFRTMYAAAMGMHDDRVAELTGYDVDTILPTVFDPPATWAPASRTEASGAAASDGSASPEVDPAEIGAYRDAAIEAGLGPHEGPGGATCPLDRPPDVVYVDAFFNAASPCWSVGGAMWCCGNYRWTAVAVTDGDGWAMASLNGDPPCTFLTEWRRIWDAGEPAFGGTAECPNHDASTGWYVLDYREGASAE
jgi:hypothetical protein